MIRVPYFMSHFKEYDIYPWGFARYVFLEEVVSQNPQETQFWVAFPWWALIITWNGVCFPVMVGRLRFLKPARFATVKLRSCFVHSYCPVDYGWRSIRHP